MPPVVVLDACVLYPASQRDFFMWLAAGGTIRAHWTNEIHEEWMRNVERDYGIARSVLERVRKLMDRAAGDALITHYRHHEHLFTKTDTKDRHVAAAAVAARRRSRADTVTIITWNLRDFDRRELAKVGVAAETPDAFLCRLFAKSPEEVIAAVVRMQSNLRNPAKTVLECADTLATQGLRNFAELIAGAID
jgi:hypothetical protein